MHAQYFNRASIKCKQSASVQSQETTVMQTYYTALGLPDTRCSLQCLTCELILKPEHPDQHTARAVYLSVQVQLRIATEGTPD